jgi:hypothetical protein
MGLMDADDPYFWFFEDTPEEEWPGPLPEHDLDWLTYWDEHTFIRVPFRGAPFIFRGPE